jgi:N-acyl-phosphatidylethanolamine-hydrolysing phospholipase D
MASGVIADAGRASDDGTRTAMPSSPPIAMPHALSRLVRSLGVIAAALATLAVSAADPPAGTLPHHRDGRFQNNYIEFEPKGIAALLKWRMDAARAGLPKPPQHETPRVAADLAFLRSNAVAGSAMVPSLTWIGHASTLIQAGGVNILTDPIFSERASPFGFVGPKRHLAPGLALAELPHIDAVVVSHNHYDHLDEASVKALAAQAGGPPLFVVPLGVKAWLAGVGIGNAVELDWWQSSRIGAVEIVLTPVQHWSGRTLTDRMETLWGGYAIFAPDFQVFFAGDTAYSKDFADIHAHFATRHGAGRGFDLALIPVGAYEPRWFMSAQHVDPAEAVRIHQDLAAERSIGIHWGTFQLTDEPLDEPPQTLARAAREAGLGEDAFSVMAVGATRRFSPRAPSGADVAAQSTATSSLSQASSVAPGASATRPCAAGSAMWIALLTWLTGSTQK